MRRNNGQLSVLWIVAVVVMAISSILITIILPTGTFWVVEAFSSVRNRNHNPKASRALTATNAKPKKNNKRKKPTTSTATAIVKPFMERTKNIGSNANQQTAASSGSSFSSLGKWIQQASTLEELLSVASQLWLPTDVNLPSHLIHQRVHHERRWRWSSQLLNKVGEIVLYDNTNDKNKHPLLFLSLQDDLRLERAILAAATPFPNEMVNTATDHMGNKEGRYLQDALFGIHVVIAKAALLADNQELQFFSDNVLWALRQLFLRAEALADVMPLPLVVEIRWACRGIRRYLSSFAQQKQQHPLPCQPKLDSRVANLPFEIVPNCIDWQQLMPDTTVSTTSVVEQLIQQIPFQFDTIVTRGGASVTERRGTAWIADPDVGALAYSGKLMPPRPISPLIKRVISQVEDHVLPTNQDPSPSFFDCALCNHYPSSDSACQFHTDPEHGSHWERLTCVVAAGAARKFAFRPIPHHTTWSEWDNNKENTAVNGRSRSTIDNNDNNIDIVPVVIPLFPGDVVKMFDTCNDDFHHAVYPAASSFNPDKDCTTTNNSSYQYPNTTGRVSLVLKRAIDRNGKKGHGISGHGRRSRRNQR
jgi:hypothetical protein